MNKKAFFLQLLMVFVVGMVGGIFGNQIIWPYLVGSQYQQKENPVYVTETKEIFIQENTALREAVEDIKDTVIGVVTQTSQGTIKGSGMILTADGLAVTLADLIPQGGSYEFFVGQESVEFNILKRDNKNNLALIKLQKEDLPTAGFVDLERMRLGERIFLIGSFLQGDQIKKMTNQGIIKYIDEDFVYTSMFETTNLKGSCLFNIERKFVGLNTVDYWGRVSTVPVDKIRAFAGL